MKETGENRNALYLTDEEAKLYLEFVQYYPKLKILLASGALTIRNGHAELHFDSGGTLMDVFITTHPYNKPKQDIADRRKVAI